MKNKIITGFLGSLTLAVMFSCSNQKSEKEQPQDKAKEPTVERVVGVARIEPEKGLLSIYSIANGQINAINVVENEVVSEGTQLLFLDNSTDAALLEIERSKIPAHNASILAAEKNAQAVNSDLQKAKQDLALNQKLFDAKGITEQALNDSKAKVEKLTLDYEKLLADNQQQQRKTQELNANVQYRQSILNDRQIKAPFDGKVLKWDVYKGDYITQGQKIGQFAPSGPLVAVTEVDELFENKVKVGMRADIISQASGQKIGEGTVIYVADFLKKKSLFSDENAVEDRRVKDVKVRLNDPTTTSINNKVDCIIYLK